MGYISLPSILNAITDITSYSCVIPEMVILHDGIKTIHNRVFPFSLKKEQNVVSFQKKQTKRFLQKKQKKTGGLFFFNKTGFSQP